jgi:hypothetical protein
MVNRFDLAQVASARSGTKRRKLARHLLLLLRAGTTLARARLALLTRSFDRAIRFGSVPLGAPNSVGGAGDIAWAMQAVGRRAPFRAKCIEQGLAAQRLLRRSGLNAILHYGVRQDSEKLEAHVWVTLDGSDVIGGAEAVHFREVASYPR